MIMLCAIAMGVLISAEKIATNRTTKKSSDGSMNAQVPLADDELARHEHILLPDVIVDLGAKQADFVSYCWQAPVSGLDKL